MNFNNDSKQGEYEKTLIEEYNKDSRKGQGMLYKHFYGYALNISKQFTYSREEAIEVMNDSFIKLFLSIPVIDTQLSLKGWLRKTIINTAIDNFRKNKKHYFHLDIIDTEPCDINEDVISKLSAEEIINLLNNLPSIYRLVFNLYEIENYSHEEIASKLKISISSSRVYLMRAKKRLRSLLKSNYL